MEELLLVRRGTPAAVDDDSTASSAASVVAWRRAPRRAGSSLATAGTSSSKTVVPSGTAPSASPSAPRSPGAPGAPSAPRCSLRRPRCLLRGTSVGDVAVEDEDAGNSWPRAAAIAATTTSRPATRRPRIRIRRVVVLAGSR